MLGALLQNNNNTQPAESPRRLPIVNIDRGGGGGSWPRYDIVDIFTAISAFPEIAGEDSLTRAARRHRWIGEALPAIKEAREKRDAVAFLVGATLADAAAEERHAAADAQRDLMDQLKIEQLVDIIDSVRNAAPPSRPHERDDGSGAGLFFGGLVVGGIIVGIALANRRSRHRR